jgi:hypothetical protein
VDGKAWLEALLGEDLVTVRLRVREPDVVFVKSIVEASEGLGAVFAEPRSARGADRDGGAIVIAGPKSRAAELFQTLEDLRCELGSSMWDDDSSA